MTLIKPFSKTLPVAMGTAALLAGSVLAAPPAAAYPPGKNLQVFTTKTVYKWKVSSNGRINKRKVVAKVNNAERGCTVTYVITGKNFTKKRVRVVNKTKGAKAVFAKGPKKVGRYKIKATISGKNAIGRPCRAESATSTFRVRHR
jgi:hypothetical protein